MKKKGIKHLKEKIEKNPKKNTSKNKESNFFSQSIQELKDQANEFLHLSNYDEAIPLIKEIMDRDSTDEEGLLLYAVAG